ncbi:hypothetical protein [Absidia glauca]|uniref:DH domain-containing protein n=1 Tax=Absidia glauca TaxID=4829 RepID=A0A168L7K1_ABSGL|nr:hypothetical protein [Absidia glauca]
MSSFYSQAVSNEYYNNGKRGSKEESRQQKQSDHYYYHPEESSSVSSYATTTGSGMSMIQRTANSHIRASDQTYEDYYYDDADIQDHETAHRNREALLQQLYTSEQTYLQSLDLIIHLFLYPLRNDHAQQQQQQQTFLTGAKKSICTQRELQWLFCNLDDIYQLHKNILKAVEQRLSSSGASQIISDILHDKIFNSLGRCYGTYLDNYHIIVSTYERLNAYAPFKKFIEIPTGCVNRYVQITTRLADATYAMHPDYSGLQQMKQAMLGLGEEIRPKIENADNVDQVLMIHQAMVDAPFSIHANRRLLLQRDLTKIILPSRRRNSTSLISVDSLKKAKVERTVILFTDLLLYVQPRQDTRRTVLQYKDHIDLESARVQILSPYQSGGLEHCFEVISGVSGVDVINTTILGGARSHVLQTRSQEDQEDWVYHLSSVITDLGRSAAKAAKEASHVNDDPIQPKLAVNTFVQVVIMLRKTFIQDSLLMMEFHPYHPIWQRSIFSDSVYLSFE